MNNKADLRHMAGRAAHRDTAEAQLSPGRKGNREGGRRGGSLRPRPGLRIAVVGCGYWGSKHVRVLSATPGVAAITIVEPDAALARATQASFPAALVSPTLGQELPHVDAVVIATPPHHIKAAAL